MTVTELEQLCYLNGEIEWLTQSIQQQKQNLQSEKSHVVLKPLAELLSTEEEILQKRIDERYRLEQYIYDIPNCEVQEIFIRRFGGGLPWEQVAASLGDGNTVDRVKKTCYRYLSAHKG